MKKLLFFAALLLGVSATTSVSAQSKWKSSSGNDTVTDATSVYHSADIPQKGVIGITAEFKKVSGTVGGAAYLEVSSAQTPTSTQWGIAPGVGAITIPNKDTCVSLSLTGSWLHYRLRDVPTGTQKHTLKVYHVLKQ